MTYIMQVYIRGSLACHILRCTCLPKAMRVLRDMFNERRKGLKRNLKKQANHPQNIFCVPRDNFFKCLCIFKIMPVVELFLKAVFI